MAKLIPNLTEEQIIAQHDSEAEARVYAALCEGLPEGRKLLVGGNW